MKLYNFSLFKKRRDAARAVVETQLNHPGAVIELKRNVNTWLELHREATKKQA